MERKSKKYTTDSVREVIIRSREQIMGIREIAKRVKKTFNCVPYFKQYEEGTTMVTPKTGKIVS